MGFVSFFMIQLGFVIISDVIVVVVYYVIVFVSVEYEVWMESWGGAFSVCFLVFLKEGFKWLVFIDFFVQEVCSYGRYLGGVYQNSQDVCKTFKYFCISQQIVVVSSFFRVSWFFYCLVFEVLCLFSIVICGWGRVYDSLLCLWFGRVVLSFVYQLVCISNFWRYRVLNWGVRREFRDWIVFTFSVFL